MNSKVTSQMIQDYVQNDPYHLVVIYANWCIYCQRMKQKLGNKFMNYNIITFLEESQVDDSLKISYPTVKIYEYGIPRDGTLNDLYNLLQIN